MNPVVGQPGKNEGDGGGLIGRPRLESPSSPPSPAAVGGYWCLQCNNAGNNQRHECAGPCIVAGRRYACSCQENHDQ